MPPHLPRPVRSHSVSVARVSRRQKTEIPESQNQHKIKMVKRSKAPSRAFDALYSLTPPFVPAIAAPDSD